MGLKETSRYVNNRKLGQNKVRKDRDRWRMEAGQMEEVLLLIMMENLKIGSSVEIDWSEAMKEWEGSEGSEEMDWNEGSVEIGADFGTGIYKDKEMSCEKGIIL